MFAKNLPHFNVYKKVIQHDIKQIKTLHQKILLLKPANFKPS